MTWRQLQPLLLLLLVVTCSALIPEFEVPQATINLLSPVGFEVSIPAVDGISLFSFHGKLNEDFTKLDVGTWSKDIVNARDGRYTFRDRVFKLKNGDIIYFWTYVIYKGFGYQQTDGFFKVEGLTPEPIISMSTAQPLIEISTQGEPLQTIQQTPPQLDPVAECSPSVTRVGYLSPKQPCAHALIFEDTFESFDKHKWRIEQRFSTQPDFEFNIFMNRSDTVDVVNGELSLGVARLGDQFNATEMHFGPECTGQKFTDECENPSMFFMPPIGSGQISTLRSFSFLYGRIEVRAQLPNADWVFPQLFLQPVEKEYGPKAYESGQMRVAWTSPGENLHGGVLLGVNMTVRMSSMCERANSAHQWMDGFHSYELNWQPDFIAVSIDGVEYCRIDEQAIQRSGAPSVNKWRQIGKKMAPFDRPFYMTLGVGVAGFNDYIDPPHVYSRAKPWRNDDLQAKWEFWKEVKNLPWPGTRSHMQVDYVRVYAL